MRHTVQLEVSRLQERQTRNRKATDVPRTNLVTLTRALPEELKERSPLAIISKPRALALLPNSRNTTKDSRIPWQQGHRARETPANPWLAIRPIIQGVGDLPQHPPNSKVHQEYGTRRTNEVR